MGQCGVDAGPMLADGAGEFDERGESTAPGPLQPGVEQRDPCGALELKHLPKLLLEQVRAIERRVGLGNPGQRRGLAVGEIAGVLPQREAGVLQVLREGLLPALAGRVPHLTPDLVERLDRPVGSARGAVPASRLVRFPGAAPRTRRASFPAPGSPHAHARPAGVESTGWVYGVGMAAPR